MAASLKCCIPKGIPMIVIQNNSPKIACDNAIANPPNINHNIFPIIYRQPDARMSVLISAPKGHRANTPSFSVWIAKGIPIIVNIRARLTIKYSLAIIIPPNISHMMFPRIFIELVLEVKDRNINKTRLSQK